MKKLVALALTVIMVLSCVVALADDSTFDRFQPYTKVDLNVLKEAGYTSSVDEYCFTAEFYPTDNILSYKVNDDTYTITLDIKAVYSAG